ncbi:hypothetical protein DVH24_038149 [Malus domestica]|uniref:Beta-glucosidase n=1 Tax=Malus domestica TaxID=3750 RepID=A0A498KDH2_MALDO|nr:hypothetical protein DVH24_038149 [Malus domestica]
MTVAVNGKPIGPPAVLDWLYIYPKGIHNLIIYQEKIKLSTQMIIYYVAGVDEFNNRSLSLEQAFKDTIRVNYHRDHLCHLKAAIQLLSQCTLFSMCVRRSGAKVKGYFTWLILDNFEWAKGYRSRFGLNYVDYEGTQNAQRNGSKLS